MSYIQFVTAQQAEAQARAHVQFVTTRENKIYLRQYKNEHEQQQEQQAAAASPGDKMVVPFGFFGARASGNALIRNPGFWATLRGRQRRNASDEWGGSRSNFRGEVEPQL